jgi:nucleotide-binding universal stress UspA family protein
MFERIALGFDGSPQARRASRVAVTLAGMFRSTLTLLIWRPGAQGVDGADLVDLVPVTETGVTRAALFEQIRAGALASGARAVETVPIQDDVLDAMLEWLEGHPQDLVIVGSRGQSRSRRLLLGSLSTGLVAGSPCPVLVVRGSRRASAKVGPTVA